MDGSAITLDLRRWWRRFRSWPVAVRLLAVIGVMIHLVAFALLAFQPWEGVPKVEKPGYIYYHDMHYAQAELLSEQSELFDTEPLLLHTKWNYRSPLELSDGERGQTNLFATYPEKTTLGTFIQNKRISERASQEMGEAEVLERLLSPSITGVFRGIGAAIEGIREPRPPQVSFTVSSLERDLVRKGTLGGELAATAHDRLWPPMQVQLYLHPGGLPSQPLVTHSSGNAELDSALIDAMLQAVTRWNLNEGYYKVQISP